MAAEQKRSWVAPVVRPITDHGSRADIPDVPAGNGRIILSGDVN